VTPSSAIRSVWSSVTTHPLIVLSSALAYCWRQKVPAGAFKNCLHTKESSALESGAEDKYHAPGVGLVKNAEFELVEIEKVK
jgi:hypothetical protein